MYYSSQPPATDAAGKLDWPAEMDWPSPYTNTTTNTTTMEEQHEEYEDYEQHYPPRLSNNSNPSVSHLLNHLRQNLVLSQHHRHSQNLNDRPTRGPITPRDDSNMNHVVQDILENAKQHRFVQQQHPSDLEHHDYHPYGHEERYPSEQQQQQQQQALNTRKETADERLERLERLTTMSTALQDGVVQSLQATRDELDQAQQQIRDLQQQLKGYETNEASTNHLLLQQDLQKIANDLLEMKHWENITVTWKIRDFIQHLQLHSSRRSPRFQSQDFGVGGYHFKLVLRLCSRGKWISIHLLHTGGINNYFPIQLNGTSITLVGQRGNSGREAAASSMSAGSITSTLNAKDTKTTIEESSGMCGWTDFCTLKEIRQSVIYQDRLELKATIRVKRISKISINTDQSLTIADFLN